MPGTSFSSYGPTLRIWRAAVIPLIFTGCAGVQGERTTKARSASLSGPRSTTSFQSSKPILGSRCSSRVLKNDFAP